MESPLARNDQDPNEGRSFLQGVAAFIGIVLIIFGVVLAAMIFISVLGYIREPADFEKLVAKWEVVVSASGTNEGPGISLERSERSDSFTTPANAENGSEATHTVSHQIHEHRVQLPVNATRLTTIGLLIVLLLVLLRIALGIIGAGAKLVAVANPYKTMHEKLLRELAHARPAQRSHRPAPPREEPRSSKYTPAGRNDDIA